MTYRNPDEKSPSLPQILLGAQQQEALKKIALLDSSELGELFDWNAVDHRFSKPVLDELGVVDGEPES